MIREGEYTKAIYTMIKEQQYDEVIAVLEGQLDIHPSSREALSLLGYCYYHIQEFTRAHMVYEKLTCLCPSNDEYRLYHAQSLYNAGLYHEAMDATTQIENPLYKEHAIKLQAAIKYTTEALSEAKTLIEKFPPDVVDTDINRGCIHYKEGQYHEALDLFIKASRVIGYNSHLYYNIALTYYKQQNIPMAAKFIGEIIENEVGKNPELGVGVSTEGIDLPSVGNTYKLHQTALVEVFNLKAAIEYDLNNAIGAQEAMTDMPPRSQEEVDPITLHNQAILYLEEQSPAEGFEKLQYLLAQPTFPVETLQNLLLLYCKYECYDSAADLMADYSHLAYKFLSPFMYDFFDALITLQTSSEEAYRKFDELANRTSKTLRKLAKNAEKATSMSQDMHASRLCAEYEDVLATKYVPAVMAQARIFWDAELYQKVEKTFRKSVDFCRDIDVWKLNVAHVIFMQENKFREAGKFYHGLVRKNFNNILENSAVVLANLCVSYIMTGDNDKAEDLMRKIEREEEAIAYEHPDRKLYHLCIVNMVIGTLYCSKGNYDFGISRIIKSLEPYNKKLGTDTWFYAKRCFLSMIEKSVKNLTTVQPAVMMDCVTFLEQCEIFGRNVKTTLDVPNNCPPSLDDIESSKIKK
ncbi:unnamed protein product [Allacma fusca]|uniref:Tetratricopeptide repeat protein 30 n=1 Tax=Allacma fusca TaxID=39272 RepID=A0A8J2PUN6_9HEXA|nr:unnamed protein product [Allacma fusca]